MEQNLEESRNNLEVSTQSLLIVILQENRHGKEEKEEWLKSRHWHINFPFVSSSNLVQ